MNVAGKERKKTGGNGAMVSPKGSRISRLGPVGLRRTVRKPPGYPSSIQHVIDLPGCEHYGET